MILEVSALWLGLVFWGAHPAASWRLDDGGWRRAAMWASPLAALSLILLLRGAAQQAGAAVAVGLGPGWPVSTEGRVAALLLLAGLLADGLALGFRGRDEPTARRLGAAIGSAGLAGFALWGELLRLGEGPGSSATSFWTAVLLRSLVGFGAGESLLPGRPRWSGLAAVALLAYPLALPGILAAELEAQGDLLTLAAGAALFLIARFLPPRAARLAVLAATALAAIVLARAGELSQLLQAPTSTAGPGAPG